MPMAKTVAIIQARMGASRLPNKMMLHLHDHPVVEWVCRRVSQAHLLNCVVIALPDNPVDDVLASYVRKLGFQVYRGSEKDLVDRFFQAARTYNADNVMRVCADNPLICASEIERLIDFFANGDWDYAYNHIPRNNQYPDGLGAEICSMALLEEIHAKAVDAAEREHLFNYVWNRAGDCKIGTFDPPEALCHPELKLDLDDMRDYMNLLAKPFRIDMDAAEIVATALRG